MTKADYRAITIALALTTASTGPQLVSLSLLMPEISIALNTSLSQLSQLNTVFSIVAIIVSLAMGFLTVKYPPKKLLLIGVISLLIGVFGAALSPNYTIMFVCFILYGIGNGFALPITNLLVSIFPEDAKTSAIGRIYSGRSLTSIFATPLIGFLANLYGWRAGYFGFGVPLILLAIIMIFYSIPNESQKNKEKKITDGFKNVLASRSAMACLVGSSLSLAFLMSLMVYNGTFMRNNLELSLQTASILMSLTFIAVAIGQVTSGSLVFRFGVKKTTYFAAFVSGVSLFAYFSLSLPLYVLILCSFLGTAAAGTTMTTMTSLALDQVQESRGTMMSLNSASMSVGSMLSSIVGGLSISRVGFVGFGYVMLIISLIATIVYYKWAKESK